jgi:predicted nucleic acid-binding protein
MWNPIAVDQAVIKNAWRIQDSFQFSWWDCLMISAAQIQDCAFFLSEDLQHQQEIDELTVLNPFLSELSQVFSFLP